ncbi:MAG: carboxypeptidase regulatory-like domain-containing protein [Candidatus Hydrogenedentes bacterium]|nr:carboxypeptidase regulatory-like domain-containing protein [Candidatus Hydrogenedentota bacterium]
MTDEVLRIPKMERACFVGLLLAVSSAVAQTPPPTGGFDGTIIDQQGMPAANAEIRLVLEDYDPQNYEGPGPNTLKRVTTSDAEGHFVFDNLPDGKYKIQAFLPGMFGVRTGRVDQGSRRPLEMDVEPAARLAGRVVDAAGKPVPGAEVYPSASLREDEIPKNWQVLWRTTTDSDGRFTLDPVYRDVWLVTVRAKGYATAVSPQTQPDTTDLTIVLTQGTTLELRATLQGTSQAVGNVPANLHSMESPDLMYTAVTDAEGYVRVENVPSGTYRVSMQHDRYVLADEGMQVTVDDSASPIPVELRLVPAASVSGRIFDADSGIGLAGVDVWSNSRRATSGEDGTYTLAGLREGPLEFRVATPRGYIEVPERKPIQIILQRGEAAEGHDFGFHKGESISGVVVTGEGKGVAGAYVNVFSKNTSSSVQTDGEGRYTISGFIVGDTYRVTASAGEEWVAEELAEVQITEGGVRDLQIKVVPAASISGRALLSTGEPVMDGRVYAVRQGDSQSSYAASTGPGGVFRLSRLAPGTYDLTISRNRMDGPSNEQPNTVVTVEPGDELKDIVVKIPGADAGAVAGRVFDADGKPVAGARVTLQHHGNPGMQEAAPYLEGQTDFDGGFRFTALPEGTCTVSVFKDSYAFAHSGELPVGTEDVRIEMERAPVIEGLVVWRETGLPVAQFSVACQDSYPSAVHGEFGGWPELGDAGGRFRWTPSHVGDAYLLVASPGSAVAVVEVPHLAPGETRTGVEVALDPGCSLRGRVVDQEGKPLAETSVQLTMADEIQGIPKWQAHTQEDGAFWFPSVSRGQHLLVLQNRRVSKSPQRFTVAFSEEGETVRDFILLPDGAVLVLVESRVPLLRLMAFCQSVAGEHGLIHTDKRDEYGNLLIEGVPPGRYYVWISDDFSPDPSRAFEVQQVDVFPGATSPVRMIRLPVPRQPQKARSD